MLPQDHVRALDFEGVLRYLRGLGTPCEPPIGVGSFLLLYASDHEVVVWYSPAREHHREGEVAIPCARLAVAWEILTGGEMLDEAALERIGGSPAYGRWLLGLLAQIPGITVRVDPVVLLWSPPESEQEEVPVLLAEPMQVAPDGSATPPKRRRRKRVDGHAKLKATG